MSTSISTRTRFLLALATLVSGILSGGILDRVLVGAPAWRAVGADAWAQYSLHADLGHGLVVYPIEGIGAAILIIAATVSFHFDRPRRRAVCTPLFLAIAFSLLGLLLTLKAAPIMLSLGTTSPAPSSRAFADFHFWGLYLRGGTDLMAFACEIWALIALGAEYEK